ncbi:MAG: hypothetical protein ACI9BH_002732, partial [Paracoccaceae bacterium]
MYCIQDTLRRSPRDGTQPREFGMKLKYSIVATAMASLVASAAVAEIKVG